MDANENNERISKPSLCLQKKKKKDFDRKNRFWKDHYSLLKKEQQWYIVIKFKLYVKNWGK